MAPPTSYTQAPRACAQTLLHIVLKAALHSLHSLHSLNFGEQTLLHILLKATLHRPHSPHSLNFGERGMEQTIRGLRSLTGTALTRYGRPRNRLFWHGMAELIRGQRQPRLQRGHTRNRATLDSLLARLLA